jgi:hypothetical protein
MHNPAVLRKAQDEVRRVLVGEYRVLEDALLELLPPARPKGTLRLHAVVLLLLPCSRGWHVAEERMTWHWATTSSAWGASRGGESSCCRRPGASLRACRWPA